jgi:hypothetical protein
MRLIPGIHCSTCNTFEEKLRPHWQLSRRSSHPQRFVVANNMLLSHQRYRDDQAGVNTYLATSMGVVTFHLHATVKPMMA